MSSTRLRDDPGSTQLKNGRGEEGDGYMRAMPFTPRVMADDFPPSFRPITFEYGGSTDHWEHLCWFENTALLHRLSDGVKCRVFAMTLTGPAHQWFRQLSAGSIPTFDKLSSMLLHH